MNHILFQCALPDKSLMMHHSITPPKEKEAFYFHTHKNAEIYVLMRGNATFGVEGYNYKMESGDILIFNNRELHRVKVDSSIPYERIAIHFDPEYITSIIKCDYDFMRIFFSRRPGVGNRISCEVAAKHSLHHLIHAYKNMLKEHSKQGEMLARMQMFRIITAISACADEVGQTFAYHPPQSKIEEILLYINENIAEDIRLEDLSHRFFLSISCICHSFKKHTGFSISSYIAHKRIIYAKELIAGGCPATQACMMSGFNDYSNFYKTYKRITGESPKEAKG